MRILSLSHPLPAYSRRPFPAMRIGRRARALSRLLAFVGITLFCLARVVLRAQAPGFTPRVGARHAQAWGRLALRVLGVQREVRGAVPAEGVLLVPNHRSYADVPAIVASLPCAFLAKAEVGRWPLIGRGARAAGSLFVTRESAESRRRARDLIFDALARGLAVTVFPEGTTHGGPGLLPFRPGAFHVAAQLGAPVVPIAIAYGDPGDAWVGDATLLGHFLERFGDPTIRVLIRFGPTLRDADGNRLRAAAEEWIRTTLAEGGPLDAREVPDRIPGPAGTSTRRPRPPEVGRGTADDGGDVFRGGPRVPVPAGNA